MPLHWKTPQRLTQCRWLTATRKQMVQDTKSGVSLRPAFQSVIDAGLPACAGGFEFLKHFRVKAQGDLSLDATAKWTTWAAKLSELLGTQFIGVRVSSDPSIDDCIHRLIKSTARYRHMSQHTLLAAVDASAKNPQFVERH